MPKVIKDVDSIIKTSAMELFVKYGYLKVDMKMISSKSQIAVGTIYHYYKNKQELYLQVLKESWEITFVKLDELIQSNHISQDKLNQLILTLYYDMKNRNGLGKVFLDNSLEEFKNSNMFNEIKENLLIKVEHIISAIFIDENYKFTLRVAETLLTSIVIMIDLHHDDDLENVAFLNNLFNQQNCN